MESEETINRIVREVIRRLGAQASAGRTPHLKIDDRVISLAAIEGKLTGIKELIVSSSAVITPAVRDELAAHDIHLTRDRHAGAPSARVLVANLAAKSMGHVTAGLADDVTTLPEATAATVLVRLAEMLVAPTVAVVFSEQPEATAHLANRNQRLRAFWGVSRHSIERAVATMNPNVMVLEADAQAADLIQRTNDFTALAQGTRGPCASQG